MREVHESRHAAGSQLSMHRHSVAYAAVVLVGRYREAGPDGLWSCGEGDLVLHPPFHAHADRFERGGARVLNVELAYPAARWLGLDRYTVVRPRDPDRLVRKTSRDPCAALAEALEGAVAVSPRLSDDWLDTLAARLAAQPGSRIGVAASELGVSPEHASREFTKRFGLGPAAYRAEQRVRRALQRLADGERSLPEVAEESGYADQAHMTRAVHATTGTSPARLRRELAV